jgi:hypothetical protein
MIEPNLNQIIKNQEILITELKKKVDSLSKELETNQSVIVKLLKKYTELLKQ